MQDSFEMIRHYELQDSKAVIRRYFTREKFDDLVTTGELHFSPASKFADPLEGFYLERGFTQLESRLRRSGQEHKWNDTELAVCTARGAWDSISMDSQKTVVISCWTLEKKENNRMWSEYGRGSLDAVALETTVGALRIALGPGFLFVPVNYDRKSMPLQKSDSLEPFFFKRAKFAWENELRIVANMEMGRRIGPRVESRLRLIIFDPVLFWLQVQLKGAEMKSLVS